MSKLTMTTKDGVLPPISSEWKIAALKARIADATAKAEEARDYCRGARYFGHAYTLKDLETIDEKLSALLAILKGGE